MVEAVFFDLDDTLYDTGRQVDSARKNAIKAMIGSGLDIGFEEAITKLNEVVEKFGSNYEYHYTELLKEFGYENNPKIIAAGIVAYHDTKKAYLVPYSDTIPTLLKLGKHGLKTGVITDGVPIKQWEKLVRLGIQNFFDIVTVNSLQETQKPNPITLIESCEKLGVEPSKSIFLGNRVDRDIAIGNKAGLTTILLAKGRYIDLKPKTQVEEPDYTIQELNEIFEVLKKIKK